MFIVIVGGGKVGTYLARALLAQEHEVVVIEKDARKAHAIANLLEVDVALVGDGCDPIVLEHAGIARADVVVADTGDDEDNLVVALISHKQSHARLIARLNNPRNRAIFESIGKERSITLVSSTEVIFDLIQRLVVGCDYEELAGFGRDEQIRLARFALGDEGPAIGKRLSSVDLPRGVVVVAIERTGGDVVVAHGETVIEQRDKVSVLASRAALDEVRRTLCGAPVLQ
jgi:trk system potassium uptake protein TrkA